MTPKEIKFPVKFDDYGTSIMDADNNKVLDIRGWGRLQYKENGAILQDRIGEWVAKTMNDAAKSDSVIEQIIKNLKDQPRVVEEIDEPEDCPAEWIRLQDAIDAVEAEA